MLEATPNLGRLLRENERMVEQWSAAPNLADESTCAGVNAATLSTWYTYFSKLTNTSYQCSLSTQNAAQFDVSLKARQYTGLSGYYQWNELLVKLWPSGIPEQLPLQAFYYLDPKGLAEAKTYQQKYATRTGGLWLPVIKLDATKMAAGTAPFSYSTADQAVKP
ncbi:hypothetical protein [Pseudomonas huanghezhanensis]|uniref:hypothetical protein n=1 Tax=Pseudomonas huanghezhanensis TaxID=3002903 RepID=UPI002285B175|nr:hypothetical protein [Pseudomonas sp. BSw22131]